MDNVVWPIQGGSYDSYEQPCQKFVKCVVVGDTAVGKTRLICSYVFNQPPMQINALYHKPHVPTVFAIDQYVGNSFIRERAKVVIDGVQVQLRIWDTFGDHEKNRKYAYQNAHVVVLCYSIGMQSSLRNVNAKWYPEIKKYCPRAAIILVGTQLDRRHTDPLLFKKSSQVTTLSDLLNNNFQGFLRRSTRFSNSNQIVLPEYGRQTSKEISAAGYFEVSIVTKHGVDEVFENSIRAVLISRRNMKPFFWSHLKYNKYIRLQKPYLPLQCEAPIIHVDNGNNIDFSCLFGDTVLYDVEFLIEDVLFQAHSLVLISTDKVFYKILMHPAVLIHFGIVLDEKVTQCENMHFGKGLINGVTYYDLPRGFETIDILADPNEKCKVFIKLSSISDEHFKQILEFIYFGRILNLNNLSSLLDKVSFFQLENMHSFLTNIIEEKPILNTAIVTKVDYERKVMLRSMFNCPAYTDFAFLKHENDAMPAHKQLLFTQCEMMKGMFRNESFKESTMELIKLGNFEEEALLPVLEYLYTGSCNHFGDSYGTLKLANYLCLKRLVNLCEVEISRDLTEMHKENNNEVYGLLIDTHTFANFHNATQLASWCLHFMAVNYNNLCRSVGKDLKGLGEKSKRYLEDNRWPPVWYLKEQDYYEKSLIQAEAEAERQRLKKRNKKRSSCF